MSGTAIGSWVIAYGSVEANKDIDKRRLQTAVVTNDLLESGHGRTEVQREGKVNSVSKLCCKQRKKWQSRLQKRI